MKIIIIAAIARNGVIGASGGLPWPSRQYPEDMAHFRDVTMGHAVVMGRHTWESIPAKFRPLPGRTNLVVTSRFTLASSIDTSPHGIEYPCSDLRDAIGEARAHGHEKLYVIGGARLYAAALPFADELDLTLIDREWEGDVKFPMGRSFYAAGMGDGYIEDQCAFKCVERTPCPTNPELTFTRWVRR